ncbi:MAG: ECF-type sigma factor [Gemmatimonadota bacterium]
MDSDSEHLAVAFSAAYDELRRLAAHLHRRDPGATLDPTGLVNEAWLKLARTPAVAHTSPLHFRRIAARAMRQVLIESARRRHAEKRGGPARITVTLDDNHPDPADVATDILSLDAALSRFAEAHPRPAAVVEARFFGGMSTPEIATVLDISEATVLRDWRAARAWLAAELDEGSP